MKFRTLFLAGIFLLAARDILARPGGLLFQARRDSQIIINNRVLADINGKAISVIDVMKKMDLIFYQQFPQYADSEEARYQFYTYKWRYFLDELINKQLILNDALENKLPVTNSDVRQEMEEIFGPNIFANLEKVGISYDEAWEMLKDELLMRRMTFVRVNSKVLKQITPIVVRQYYDKWAEQNAKKPEWRYQMISLSAKDPTKAEKAAQALHEKLAAKAILLDEAASFTSTNPDYRNIQVSVSVELVQSSDEVAAENLSILENLQPHELSPPVAQESRRDQSIVYRLFHLHEYVPGSAPSFLQVQEKLKYELLEKASEKEMAAYIKKLRKHYNINEKVLQSYLPENFVPFSLE